MIFHSHRMANGLEVVAESHPSAHSAAVGFFVRAGARDENDGIAGISHFLEHMVFKGTESRDVDQVNREFDAMGAHYNAYTSEEATVYYAAILPEKLGDAVALWADLLRPALRAEDFATEKNVILEEIRMHEDEPPFGADEKCRALCFGDHPLGRDVLGTPESITAMRPEQMREYHRLYYAADNIILAAAGRLDFDALVATAERCCGAWAPGGARRAPTPATMREGCHVIEKPTAAQQYVLRMSAAPSATDPDRFAAILLSMILGDDLGSRLYWELVDPGLAEHATVAHAEYEEAGAWLVSICCEPQQAADNLRRAVNVFRAAEADGVAEAELRQAQSKLMSRVVLAAERPRGRMFAVGGNWLYRREYRSVEQDLDEVAAVSIDRIAAVAKRYPLSRAMTVTIGPLATLGNTPAAT